MGRLRHLYDLGLDDRPGQPQYCRSSSDCDTGGYCETYKTPSEVFLCHGGDDTDYCTGDGDCSGSYCMNGAGKSPAKAYQCHNAVQATASMVQVELA